jgi:signal peptidase I
MNDSESWQWVKLLTLALILAFAVRHFLFTPIIVDGQSMLPTLDHEDRMLVNKVGYQMFEPERFDIIVFHAEKDKDYIKRVIGLPGDKLKYKNDTLYINGESYEEEYLDNFKETASILPLTQDFELADVSEYEEIPENHLFVMGDNRQFSKDSRHIDVVSYEKIVGEANVVFWPFQGVRLVD